MNIDTTYSMSDDINRQIDVSRALHSLSGRERELVELRYGLNGSGRHTLDQIGDFFGVTGERVRQIEEKALRKLERPLRNYGDYPLSEDDSVLGLPLSTSVLDRLIHAGVYGMTQLKGLYYSGELQYLPGIGKRTVAQVGTVL